MNNKFRRPEEINLKDLESIVAKLKENLKELVSGNINTEEGISFIGELLKNQDQNGSWGLVNPRETHPEVSIDFYFKPTYYSTAFLIKFLMTYPNEAKEFPTYMSTLSKGLNASIQRRFTGHSYDSISGVIETMKIFCLVDVEKFILKHPTLCPEFYSLVVNIVDEFKENLKSGDTKDGWGSDYADGYKEIVNHFTKEQEEIFVFVYGTLMKGNSNYNSYLKDSSFFSEAILNDYALYNLGSYPGINASIGDKVKGEIYKIDQQTLERLNILEGEGSLYILKEETVLLPDKSEKKVMVYVYNNDINKSNKVPFYNQPWGRVTNINPDDYVWYASYGSNMLVERFLSYINGGLCKFNGKTYNICKDISLPIDDRSWTIPYRMYFGNESSSWGPGGVSFLDSNEKGESLGRMYLITKEQYEHVRGEEGTSSNWYNKVLDLGMCEGIQIKTITNEGLRKEAKPIDRYYKVLVKGIMETYPEMSQVDVESYICAC